MGQRCHARTHGLVCVRNLPRVLVRCVCIAMKRSRTSHGHGMLAPEAGTTGRPSTSADDIVRYQRSHCPECSCELHPSAQEVVTAAVLDVTGWKTSFREPPCCRHSKCALRGKRVWHNFIAKTMSAHVWAWPSGRKMQCFLWSGWGVTTAWLRQVSRRLVHSMHCSMEELPCACRFLRARRDRAKSCGCQVVPSMVCLASCHPSRITWAALSYAIERNKLALQPATAH